MSDPDAFIAHADQSVQVRLADVLELRAADPQQRAAVQSCFPSLAALAPRRPGR